MHSVDSDSSMPKSMANQSRMYQKTHRGDRFIKLIGITILSCLIYLYSFGKPSISGLGPYCRQSRLERFQACSIEQFLDTGLPFLDDVLPLPVEEFAERRLRLAKSLISANIDAFIVEPGYTFQYYANISQKDWEVWEPEERPFLMIIQADEDEVTGEVKARTKFLAPSFEVERVRLLGMPFQAGEKELEIIGWEEHWNPYTTLRDSWWSSNETSTQSPRVMVDEEMRDFIQRGLSRNGFEVIGLQGEVERVKQTKSPREIEILRAVNSGTVEAVRAMRSCMYPGLSENEVASVLDATLRAAGLEPFFDIVLFDENASNPHGGTNGSKTLEAETFVLIDVGAHLYGYSSDICRTFFPPFLAQPSSTDIVPASIAHKIAVWEVVSAAQSASFTMLKPNNTAASVDIAARDVISAAGYGDYFTHRVGHGIGIKAHESPYLNQGNVETRLKAGMVFTSEPGIYLVEQFGARTEDVLLVKEDGEVDILSGTLAKGPWNP